MQNADNKHTLKEQITFLPKRKKKHASQQSYAHWIADFLKFLHSFALYVYFTSN